MTEVGLNKRGGPHGLRTDAAFVVVGERPRGVLEVSALQATVLEHEGTTLAAAVDHEDFHLSDCPVICNPRLENLVAGRS